MKRSLLILILLTGCFQTIVHEETKQVKGNQAEFLFNLDGNATSYEINLELHYVLDKKIGIAKRKKVEAELALPSGERLKKINHLITEDAKASTIPAMKNIRFINIKAEEGNYNLSFKKEPGRTTIQKAKVTTRKFKD